MPALPMWFHHLPVILAELRALTCPYLDRHAIEKIFHIRQRRARQLMAGLPALRVGNAVAVERIALIERLEAIARSSPFQWERARLLRVGETLEVLRRHAAARHFSIPTSRPSRSCAFHNLSAEIALRPGELHITFTDPTDLASKLFELSQARVNDWIAFQQALDPQDPS